MADSRGDTLLQKKYAEDFVRQASDTLYGNMYNKYLIEMYTGILKNPVKAEYLAKKELENRSTPQTRAWYAWTLFSNNKKEVAMDQFQRNISGKPLEGFELYWMGKLMQGMNKTYNAHAFFEAAYTNKYDLAPGIRHDLEIQASALKQHCLQEYLYPDSATHSRSQQRKLKTLWQALRPPWLVPTTGDAA